ncbi:hypothetical protein [Streptomyces sp. NPDC048248]|uniref:hypothetical protein n=1 Tax=Streptomyces sp. NPDC048248 TaxID=3365523 RepID=UPI003715E8FA
MRRNLPRSRSARALTDLLLLMYGRVPVDSDTFEVVGDVELLEFLSARALFG